MYCIYFHQGPVSRLCESPTSAVGRLLNVIRAATGGATWNYYELHLESPNHHYALGGRVSSDVTQDEAMEFVQLDTVIASPLPQFYT